MNIPQPNSVTLEDLAPKLRAYIPLLGEAVTALLPELRVAEKLGLMDGRSRLGTDKENLTRDAGELLVFREEIAQTEDTKAAEEALITLVADMRVRIAALLKDRASAIRVNSEVSAHRADPAALETMDLTDGFCLMAAHPTRVDADADGLIIENLGLPETGGKSGKITGHILVGRFPKTSKQYLNDAAPLDTFYLPAGRSVRLMLGEQVRMHMCGYGTENSEITLEQFSENPEHMEVEAISENVEIHGPATFSLSRQIKISEIMKTRDEMRSAGIKQAMTSQVDTIGEVCGWLVSLPIMVMGVAVVAIENITGMTIILSCLLFQCERVRRRVWEWRRVKNLSDHTKKMLNRFGGAFFGKDFSLRTSSAKQVLRLMQNEFDERSSFRFYPVRKVVISDRKGVQEIEPLIALPAPDPAFDDPQVIRMPIRKT